MAREHSGDYQEEGEGLAGESGELNYPGGEGGSVMTEALQQAPFDVQYNVILFVQHCNPCIVQSL